MLLQHQHLQSEEIAVGDAYGRILSGDVYSRMDFPPFDKALKDGFAICSQDSFGASEESPKTLEVIDFLEAGSTTDKVVEPGKCIEISTGAVMPKGADAVVMVEYCEKMDSKVNILTTTTPTQDVAKKGSDTKESKLILKKRDVLTPVKLVFYFLKDLRLLKSIKNQQLVLYQLEMKLLFRKLNYPMVKSTMLMEI